MRILKTDDSEESDNDPATQWLIAMIISE